MRSADEPLPKSSNESFCDLIISWMGKIVVRLLVDTRVDD